MSQLPDCIGTEDACVVSRYTYHAQKLAVVCAVAFVAISAAIVNKKIKEFLVKTYLLFALQKYAMPEVSSNTLPHVDAISFAGDIIHGTPVNIV